MANDVSYFKVSGDSTTYQFNDPDAETAINANASAIGTLSNLTTSAKGSLVAAINEVDAHADTNASAISSLNSNLNRIAGFTLLASGTNVNSLTTTGIYLVGDPSVISNLPSGVSYGQLYVYTTSPYTRQIFFDFASNTPFERWTAVGGSNWSAWVSNIATLKDNLSKVLQSTELSSGDDLDNVKTPGFYYIRSGVANCPEDWTWMIVIGGLGIRQVLFRTNLISTRAYTGSPLAWTTWKSATLS